MIALCAAAAFFVGIHFFVSGTALRGRLVARLGELPYLGLFSLASVAGITWLSMAYGRAGYVELWGQLHGLRGPALVGMLVASFFVVQGVLTASPTAVGSGAAPDAGAARGILRVTRHPFLWGVALWAAVHLIVNGDLASLVLFGSLLLLALVGPHSIDRKRARAAGEGWERFAAVTSNVPFAAILAGRNQLRWRELGAWKPLAALAAYAALLLAHRPLFGVSPLPF